MQAKTSARRRMAFAILVATMSVSCDEPQSLTLLFTHLGAGPMTGDRYAGLDLDGIDTTEVTGTSDACAQQFADSRSSFAEDELGVDNVWGYLMRPEGCPAPCEPTNRLDDLIRSGTYLLAVHVPNADGIGDGPVDVVVGLVRRPDCSPADPAACALLLADGDVLADQPVEFTATTFDATATVQGDVLEVVVPSLPVPIVVLEGTTPSADAVVNLTHARFSVPLDASRAALPVGGRVTVAESQRFGEEAGIGVPPAELETILRAYADLGETPEAVQPCTALSVGFEAEVTRVDGRLASE